MRKFKYYKLSFLKWLDKQTPIICGICLGLILGFIEYLAFAPYEKVEWFYGPKKKILPEKEMHIIYKNGVPADTIVIEKIIV